ncbi:unnamed protein product [Darwinula stevensoni]|uniref:ABC transporter domain-containing protein n=1 Tax=Darwinula stevensoni TaxID=69355 RepID=A0A7R8XAQ0_9CRUS|nr:unnamed protein product [Darwinula stevensoni]CAG0892106.1 unnamed protein product [Darwinula stevensoni]
MSFPGGDESSRQECCGAGMKEILKGLDGRMKSGELTAVMGPSGSGKSSLMNILAGYRQKDVTGKVEVNGRERNLHMFRHQSCYIPQEDQVIPTLTVMESMLFAAGLKLPSSLSFKDKYSSVVEILQHLGMQDCARTRASFLSGGQRKRLCIALELLADPPILFLDEPTSGLDSSTCLQCVTLLKMLAREGRTVICTVHHPSVKILEMFDHLILLADGRCLYNGTISSLVPYFRQFDLHCPPYHNPADFVVEVAAGLYGREAMTVLSDAAKADAALPVALEEPDPHAPSNADSKSSNDSHRLWGRVKNMLETRPEVVGDVTTDYPVSFATQVKYLYMRCLKTTSRDLWLLHVRVATHVMVGLFMGIFFYGKGDDASSMYQNVSSLFFTILFVFFAAMMPTIAAVFVGVAVLAPFLLFSGFFLSVKALPKYMSWVSHLSFLKYYFEGTMVCIYGYNRSDLVCNQPFCQFKDPDKFLKELDLQDNVYWIDFWVLVLYNVVLRFVSYFVLRWKLHHSL